METGSNKELMREIYRGLERGDATLFRRSLCEDFTWTITGKNSWSASYSGGLAAVNDAFLKVLYSRMALPNRFRVNRVIAEGDVVVVEGKGDNTTIDGEPYCNDYCLIYRFRDGKIAEMTEYMDSAYCEAVLGRFDVVKAEFEAKAKPAGD